MIDCVYNLCFVSSQNVANTWSSSHFESQFAIESFRAVCSGEKFIKIMHIVRVCNVFVSSDEKDVLMDDCLILESAPCWGKNC